LQKGKSHYRKNTNSGVHLGNRQSPKRKYGPRLGESVEKNAEKGGKLTLWSPAGQKRETKGRQ